MANVDFFIFAGQSNCGRSRTSEMSAGEQAEFAITVPQTFIYNPIVSAALQPMQVGVNTRLQNFANTNEFGLEASLLKDFNDADPENRYIFKYGYGSTDLQFNWNSRRVGSKFYDLSARLDLVIPLIQAAGDTPILKAFIWMQGENDATDENWAADYLTNLQHFFDDFADLWADKRLNFSLPGTPDYRVVIGKINGINDPSMEFRDVVRQAQEDFCAIPGNKAILIDTDAYTFRDVVHYDATSQIQFGHDVFDALNIPPVINIFGGKPNVLVAKGTATFLEAGITEENTEIIYLVDNPLKSYIPGRSINGIAGFETGKGYYIVAKADMNLSNVLIPPVPEV